MGSKVFKEKEKLTFIDLQPPQIIELRKKRLSLEKKKQKENLVVIMIKSNSKVKAKIVPSGGVEVSELDLIIMNQTLPR